MMKTFVCLFTHLSLIRMRQFVRQLARYSKGAGIGIASSTLGNMNLRIFSDSIQVIPTSTKFIRYDWEAIHSLSLRRDGVRYARNSKLSHGAGYSRCTRNVNIGLSVIWTMFFGQVWWAGMIVWIITMGYVHFNIILNFAGQYEKVIHALWETKEKEDPNEQRIGYLKWH